jgi:hypothetical protein
MSDIEKISQTIEEVAGQPVGYTIENNVMLISPAEAGIVLLGAVASFHQQNEEGWQEADRLASLIEQLRDDNAFLRSLLEDVRATLIELGQDKLAERIMDAAYPVSGVYDDGTEVRF